MARIKSKGCAIDARSRLKRMQVALSNNVASFEQAQKEIDIAYKEYLAAKNSDNPPAGSFKDLIIQYGLQDYGFAYEGSDALPSQQLVIKSLDTKNPNFYKFKETAKEKIRSRLSREVFKALFVDRSENYVGINPYVTLKSNINININALKNQFCKDIVEALNIVSLKGANFYTTQLVEENGESNYNRLMHAQEVFNFLDNMEKLLLNPYLDKDQFEILAKLIILNNFDEMISNELDFLISISPEAKGSIYNTNYIRDNKNDQIESYSMDEHEWASAKNYTSNLARFIVSNIPKVLNGEVQEDQYLSESDLYVFANLLRQAEYEYMLLHPENPIILNQNTTEGAKKLLMAKDQLPCFKSAKKVLIDSIEYFLYKKDNSGNLPIASLYTKYYAIDPNILDIESVIMFEAAQSFAPTYAEFNEYGMAEMKNYGGAYEVGNELQNHLSSFLASELYSKNSLLAKTPSAALAKVEENTQIVDHFLINGLGLSSADSFIIRGFKKRHLAIIRNLLKNLRFEFTKIKESEEWKADKNSLEITNFIDSKVKSIIRDLKGSKEIQAAASAFMEEYTQYTSSRAITQFDSNGVTIPTYRLGSAVVQDPLFIQMYKQHQKALGISKGLNLLVDNPHIFSKYNLPSSDLTTDNHNIKYRGSTTFLLGKNNKGQVVDYYKMNPSDLLLMNLVHSLTLFHDRKTLPTQPVCYSDKTSVATKDVNLLAQIPSLETEGEYITLQDLFDLNPTNIKDAIAKIQKYDFVFRRNRQLVLMHSILSKWKNILNVAGFIEAAQKINLPDLTDLKLMEISSIDITKAINTLLNSWHKLDTTLKKDSFLKENLPHFIQTASNIGEALTAELDYSGSGLNSTIFYDFNTQCKSLDAYRKYSNEMLDALMQNPRYLQMKQNLLVNIDNSRNNSDLKTLMVQGILPNQTKIPRLIQRPKNAKKGSGHYNFMTDSSGNLLIDNIYKILTVAQNLVRSNYLDLVSKNEYLDPAKGKTSSEEQIKAKRIDAMAKRMVLYPATIQQFIQGKIDGVSREIKVAIIDDPKEETWNPQGDTHDQDIYDGSGLISPFQSMMEDNSVVGHGIQGTKKTLGTSTQGHISSLFKWAEFIITNEKMRNSLGNKYDLLYLFKQMHNETWDNIDITKTWLGNGAQLTNPGKLIGQTLYIRKGFNYYRIDSIKNVDINQYKIVYVPVNLDGSDMQITNPKTGMQEMAPEQSEIKNINSIYSLWETLGGLNSYELNPSSGELESSENSIKATFKYIIFAGSRKSRNFGSISQNTVNQPLRDKFIAIAANKSAVKRGQANINPSKIAWIKPKKGEPETPLAYFTINTQCFGVQLDANHHSDLADVREMSQTISTLAALGRTADLAQQAYNEIGDLVRSALTRLNRGLELSQVKGIDAAIEYFSKKLIDELAKDRDAQGIEYFIDMFADQMDTVQLPISNRILYRPFVKMILTDLNKSALIRRYTGLGGVLNPASNIMQIYEVRGKKYLFQDLLNKAINFFNDPKNNSIFKNTLESYFSAHPELTEAQKNLTIVRAYIRSLYKQDISQVGLRPESLLDTPMWIPMETAEALNEIAPLDTIVIKETGKDLEHITLDSRDTYLDFCRRVEKHMNNGVLDPDFQVYLDVEAPHDLRPQHIKWMTEQDGVKHSFNSYNTVETKLLARANSKAAQVNDDYLDSLFDELQDINQQSENSCNG